VRGAPWIPPTGLLAGQLAHGLSWVLLAFLALRGVAAGSIQSLSWVHLIGLAWLSTIALSVLLFVLPQFTDVRWRAESLARAGVAVFAAGAFALATAFWLANWPFVRGAAVVVAAGLLGYVVAACLTLAAALRGAPAERAIARALLAVFAFFAVAAALGVAMTWASSASHLLRSGPAIHAHFAGLGWLTLLVMGVSVRTVGAIAGARSARRWPHIASGASCALAVLVLASGLWWGLDALEWLGSAAAGAGVLIYALDMLDVLRRARVTHRPPQAFLMAGLLWLLVAATLGIGVVAGEPWGPAYVYVALVGWLGQMVNGHLHHIGVRLMATMARGDDDETPPGALLNGALTWLTFWCFQLAVLVGTTGLLAGAPAFLLAAAIAGATGWLAMALNLAAAWRAAHAVTL